MGKIPVSASGRVRCAAALLVILISSSALAAAGPNNYYAGVYSETNGTGRPFSVLSSGLYGTILPGVTTLTNAGTIKTTFTWEGAASAVPSVVIVEEDCVVSWSGTSGSCDNGFQDPPSPITGGPPSNIYNQSQGTANGVTIQHFWVMQNPAATFTISRSVSVTGNNINPSPPYPAPHVSANVGYHATVYPATITLSGGTVVTGQNGSATYEYLIGQLASASVSCAPMTIVSGTWNVSGGSPFASFAIVPGSNNPPTVGSGHMTPLALPEIMTQTNQSFAGCFATAADAVVLTAQVILAPPSGGVLIGSGAATVTAQFATVAPTFTVAAISGDASDPVGTLALSTPGDNGFTFGGTFNDGQPPPTAYGFGVKASVALPTGFSEGYWDWAQIVDITDYCRLTDLDELEWAYEYDTSTYTVGHDANFPYSTVHPAYDQNVGAPPLAHWTYADGTTGMGDTVIDTFDDGCTIYYPSLSFYDYAMFLPGGTGSQHVPLWEVDWGFGGTFTQTDATHNIWTQNFPSGVTTDPGTVGIQHFNPGFPDWSHDLWPGFLWE